MDGDSELGLIAGNDAVVENAVCSGRYIANCNDEGRWCDQHAVEIEGCSLPPCGYEGNGAENKQCVTHAKVEQIGMEIWVERKKAEAGSPRCCSLM